MSTESNWTYWTTTRTGMSNADPATLRYGKDTPPVDGMLFQHPGTRPLHLSGMISSDDGGVVTHSLQWIGKNGMEHWTCDSDSTQQNDFKKMWPNAIIFPDDWKFEERDYQEGLNPDYQKPA